MKPQYDDFETIQTEMRKLLDQKASFLDQLIELKKQIDRSEYKRDLSTQCGIVFEDNLICVNIHKLRKTLGRCKSAINNSFKRLGYRAVENIELKRETLTKLFPSIAHKNDIKQWSIRESEHPCIQLIEQERKIDNSKLDLSGWEKEEIEQFCAYINQEFDHGH